MAMDRATTKALGITIKKQLAAKVLGASFTPRGPLLYECKILEIANLLYQVYDIDKLKGRRYAHEVAAGSTEKAGYIYEKLAEGWKPNSIFLPSKRVVGSAEGS